MPEDRLAIRVAVSAETRTKARLLAALWGVPLNEAIARAVSAALQQAQKDSTLIQK